ncbi:TPA: SIR2 family protein [Clostridioides difficile]
MNTQTLESLKKINEASVNGKLVVFVGAGVSAISGYPNWSNLVDKLNLGQKKEYYSDDEYLSIPQKYYDSRGHKEYYDSIKQEFDIDLEPNEIHDKILKLKPTHIITTNYDNLIEKAIVKKGLFYDVISSDSDVSNTNSRNFIIKMHGELKKENIVLKEEDFIRYEEDFKLIETLVKSILASNLVVFVGYSIKEINIKKILNWIKSLQGKSFQPAYWLYIGNISKIGEELSKSDYDYYKNRGINIVNYNDLSRDNENLNTYESRYNKLLDSLIDINLFVDSDIGEKNNFDKLYNELIPLNKLYRIRKKDLLNKINKIDKKYYLAEDGIIISEVENKNGCIETFNEIYNKMKKNENICDVDIKKYQFIENIFNKSDIFGYKNINFKHSIKYEFDISYEKEEYENYYCKFEYNNMLNKMHNVNKTTEEDYKKAFYLYKLNNLRDAYTLYSNIAIESFKCKNYLLYYLSQVNRYWIGQIIIRRNSIIDEYSDFVNKIELDLCDLDISNLFKSLPFSFRNNFKTLENLGDFIFIYNSLYKTTRDAKKIDMNRKGNVYEFGINSLIRFRLYIKEIIEFLNENYLIMDDYDEIKVLLKEYINIFLTEYSMQFKPILKKNVFGIKSKQKYFFTYIDILIVTRYIENKDLKKIFSDLNITKVYIYNNSFCIKILENLSKFILEKNVIEINIFNELFQNLKNELNNILFILRYMEISTQEYMKIIEIIKQIDNKFLEMNEKILFLDKQQMYNLNLDGSIIDILDNWLYEEFVKDILLNEKVEKEYISISNYVHIKNTKYVSKIDMLLYNQIDNISDYKIKYLIKLKIVLSDKTISRLKNKLIKILNLEFNFDLFELLLSYELLEDTLDIEKELYTYLKNEEKNKGKNSFKEKLDIVGAYIFIGKISKEKFIEFEKYSENMKFLINPNEYNYDNFRDEWILEYSKLFHEKLSQTKAGKIIKAKLEKYIKSGQNDKDLLELYFDVYSNVN